VSVDPNSKDEQLQDKKHRLTLDAQFNRPKIRNKTSSMRKSRFLKLFGIAGLLFTGGLLISGDHIDSPAVAGTTADLASLYAFEGDSPNNTVLIATLQAALVPGQVTQNAQFDEDVMIEFNIDNTGDFVEDLVIQAVKRGDSMYFFGPAQPVRTGLESEVATFAERNAVKISEIGDVQITNNNGMSFFAGPRRDPFFFDLDRFGIITDKTVVPQGFLPPGEATDYYAGLNVLAVAVEVPNSMLGTPPTHIGESFGVTSLPPSYNVWVSTKRKQ
jgi:hypothetical protein